MRIFTAIPIPEQTKTKLAALIDRRLPVHYVNMTNLHVTLNFFGELDTDQVSMVKETWDDPLTGQKPFTISFDQIGRSRDQIHMTVVPSRELADLQSAMQEHYQRLGFRFNERGYHPHVKLANMNMDKVMNKERKIESFPNEELKTLDFSVEKIVLYESKLLLHHVHHIPMAEHNLT